jgi:predicted nucleotidyltransferase
MKDAVQPSVAEEIRAVFRRHPEVQRATLFGSRAKGNFREGSDIDLALEGNALESRHLATMHPGELDETPIPQKVDLLLKKTLHHQELLDHIERVGVVFMTGKPGRLDAESCCAHRPACPSRFLKDIPLLESMLSTNGRK